MHAKEVLEAAHKHSLCNLRKLVTVPQKCGCFYCCSIFDSSEIKDWTYDIPEYTALCPYCEIDSVIGEKSGYPITEVFMEEMHDYWF